MSVGASGADTSDGGEEDEGDVWEDDYGMDEDDEGPSGGDNLDWRTQMKLDDLANKPAKRYQDADDDDYFMKPASASSMKDDENAWASPSNPFMSSDFSSGPDDGWLDNDDWLQPAYTEVTAEPGSILEKVQRLHLGEPADHTFQDGEYFTLTNFVKQKADNDFCLVLEVAERARERKIERLESLHPTPEINALPEIQQAIVDLALEVDASGGKTSAFLAMSEAADRARLRWELQEASWCWDNWVEEHMSQFGISERAAKLLHMGERVEDAMDFEASLYDRDDGGFPGRR